jgi:hypothetical protein
MLSAIRRAYDQEGKGARSRNSSLAGLSGDKKLQTAGQIMELFHYPTQPIDIIGVKNSQFQFVKAASEVLGG